MRGLASARGYTAIILVTLALGTGAYVLAARLVGVRELGSLLALRRGD